MEPLSFLSFWKKGMNFSAATSRPWELCFSLLDNRLYVYFQEKKNLLFLMIYVFGWVVDTMSQHMLLP